jgi:FK506-binding protein 2
MRLALLLTLLPLALAGLTEMERLPKLDGLEVQETVAKEDAKRRTQRGDTIDVHYRGTLQKDGSEFDSSYNRGQPLSFTVGKGQVIKG